MFINTQPREKREEEKREKVKEKNAIGALKNMISEFEAEKENE